MGLEKEGIKNLKQKVTDIRNKLNVYVSILSILFTFVFVWLLDSVNSTQKDFKEIFDPTHHQIKNETICRNVTERGNNAENDNLTDPLVKEICETRSITDSVGEHVLSYTPVIVCAGTK